MQRIYLQIPFSENIILSEKEIYHQLTRVMRARVGQKVIFFDGISQEDSLYEITHIDKNSVTLTLNVTLQKNSEIFQELILYQALPNKLEKIEYIIQKACEIGYKKIIFFMSERSQKQTITENKLQRFQKILVESIEQCGGNMIPELIFLDTFDSALATLEEDGSTTLVCHTLGERAVDLSEVGDATKYNIFVGSEGGFSEQELQILGDFQSVYFGSRILRCETVSSVIGFYLSQKKQ